jgi:hypothetical protein
MSNSKLTLGCQLDLENPPYTPDPHDYSFLQEEINFSVPAHARLVNRLFEKLKNCHLEDEKVFTQMTADYVAGPIDKVIQLNKKSEAKKGDPMKPRVLISRSLFPKFASRPINDKLLFDIAMLIAGNMDILIRDQVIVPNYDLKYPAWMPFSVVDVQDDKEKPMNKRVSFFAESGIFAGSKITKYMSAKFMRFIVRQTGAPRGADIDARDIFGTKMSILVCRDGSGMGLKEFSVSTSQKEHNKRLFKVRYGDRPCHLDMVNTCANCVYGTDVCEFAVYKNSQLDEENND